ncbi:MAG: double-strand break repair helicase AddA [Beijerinckiaceae bacterium]|nr:double-strand break repair helicase AddA [Beijerinckiaceae bacterium]
MAPFGTPPETREKQHKASNPSRSVWVSANAGTGKTHVLASRVVRLLLQGAAPSRILCLTYTKAAAANMADRVFDKLARWTRLPDDELSKDITGIGAPKPGGAELARARKLFAHAVETPGGLKIQTIHAFCERLLHLFPFEANVPACFEVADELRQAELLQAARRAVLAEANAGKGALGAALLRLMEECSADDFEGLIKEALRHAPGFHTPAQSEPAEVLRRILCLAEGNDVNAIERGMAGDGIAPGRWNEIAAKLDESTPFDQKNAQRFRQAFLHYQSAATVGSLESCLESYLSIFFTEKGTARESLITKGLTKKYPDLEEMLIAEQSRLGLLRADRKKAATLARTGALIEIARAVSGSYRAHKSTQTILDFEDLIGKTLAMLERSDARWVHYKLDLGIDHILVDEAQDTSKAQWKILEELTSEFSAGQGQSQVTRTFFAVGDEKQSIFSFLGAAPQMFGAMRRKFASRFRDGGRSFAEVGLTLSFRSVPGVLSIVDKVFEHGDHKDGLIAANDVWMQHNAWKRELPGLIELWPLVKAEEGNEPRGWTLPSNFPDAADPANVVAKRVADKIKQLTGPGSNEFVHDSETLQPRPVRPGDILILVRKRGDFFEAMIRALKDSQIPAAGADRLDLVNHIAVMDLIAAGRVSLLPNDDLSLASVLKSPLIGLGDDDLLALAPDRGGSLHDALAASSEPRHAAAAAKLARWRGRAGEAPFAFYAHLLGADGGRRDFEARLGAESCDAIDEFLRLAMTHEDTRTPSLSTFLNDIAGLEYKVKRDMEGAGDAVRVMTVHAAKGLEAKIVFLPESCSVPSAQHDPKVFKLTQDVLDEETIAWSPRKELDCEKITGAREKKRAEAWEEYRRLLYVALTRAEERLYIAGSYRAKEPDPGCWAKMIEASLTLDPAFEEVPAFWNGGDPIRRFISAGAGTRAGALSAIGEAAPARASLPEWLHRAAPQEAKAQPPLRPSYALDASGSYSGAGTPRERRDALRRGRLMHLLLQYLPEAAPENRRQAALAFLAARAPAMDESARQRLAGEALALIALPELSALFGPGSKAEVSVAGRIRLGEREIEVAGKVDRIGETENEVFLAEYKTGVPYALAETPAPYLAQMALYRAVLAPLWPDKNLRALLIWTARPRADWLPEEMLGGALASLAR